MSTLFILNGPAYGNETSYNGLRLASAVAKRTGEGIRVFLLGDGVTVAKRGQRVPEGYFNLERMLRAVLQRGTDIGACGTCMDARGMTDSDLVDGVHRGTLDQLADWTGDADRVLVF